MTTSASSEGSASLRPMLGLLLVKVVFVEGTVTPTFTDDERRRLLKYIETGAKHLVDLHDGWRGRQQPPVVRSCGFTITSERVAIELDPSTLPPRTNTSKATSADFEALDLRWIDLALEGLGQSKAVTPRLEDRMRALVTEATLGQLFAGAVPADCFVMFVTKYPCHWMAYALENSVTLCPPMLDAGGWKDRYDLVAAHETGHVFGAPDEYVDGNITCDPDKEAGPFNETNGNCELNPTPTVKCLMRASDLALCEHTPLHWGWRDLNRDGTVDLLEPPTIDRFAVFDPLDTVWIEDCHAAAPRWTLRINGRNAWDARVVSFGDTPSPQLMHIAPDEVDVTVPELPQDAPGIVTVSFITRAGITQATFEQSWFLVAQPVPVPAGPPVIFGLLPSTGPPGTPVTILGDGLQFPTSVRFGRVLADLSGLPPGDDRSPTNLEVVAPAGPAGSVPVVVTSDRGSSQRWLMSTFTYR